MSPPTASGHYAFKTMYTDFFGLNEKPFAITPDPRYLYLSERHAEALAHLLYGITESGGFIQLTGEVGTGKTTLVRSLLERLPEHADVALILNPRLSPLEFLQAICEELHVPPPQKRTSPKQLVDALNGVLLAAHANNRRIVLIVDEAQNLSAEVLEQVRLLTNLETAKQKLLQIILIGQPELRDKLNRDHLRQLAQRITGRYHLEALARAESAEYVRHRLQVAGATTDIFTATAMLEIHRLSGGIPRLINVIGDRALLGAYTLDEHRVSAKLTRQAAAEVFGRRIRPRWWTWLGAGLVTAGVAAGAVGVWQGLPSADPIVAETTVDLAAPPTMEIVTETVSVVEPQSEHESAPLMDQSITESTTPLISPSITPSITDTPIGLETIGLPELLGSDSALTGTNAAFGELFSLWGAEYRAEEGPPCEQSVSQGLHCVFQQGTLAELRVLDRPAILSVLDEQGAEHQIVLSGLGDGQAQFLIGGTPHEVGLGELSRYWFGEYLLLWRPPTDTVETLTVGARGNAVVWLRRSFASLDGRQEQTSPTDYYDAELANRVRSFQRDHRLDVDGIAGVQTQIVLNTELKLPETPYLVETAQ